MNEPRQIESIASLDDPRIAPYRNLRDRELASDDGRFIAESELVVRRLLDSPWPVDSVLLAERRAEELAPLAPPGVPVYVAPHSLVNSIVGFRFHSGVIACGRRPATPALDDVARRWAGPALVVVLPEIISTENMGALLRISAAFGADAVLIGPRSCDPYYRQSIRVSMGTVFHLKLIRSTDLLTDLRRLRSEYGVELAATVLDDAAEPLATARRAQRLGVLLGNEAQGLSPAEIAACDRKITIPMKLGTDSLNVAVAAGIVLHHFTHVAAPSV